MDTTKPLLIVGLPRSGTTWVGEVFSTAKHTQYLFEPDNEKISPLAWLCKEELQRFPYLTARDNAPLYQKLWHTILKGKKWNWVANTALGVILKQKAFEVEASIGNKSGYVYVDDRMHRVGGRHIESYQVGDHPVMALLTRQLLVNKIPDNQGQRMIIKSVHASLSTGWIDSHFPVKVIFVLRNPYSLYASYKRMKMPDGFRNLLFQNTLQRDVLQYLPNSKQAFIVERDEPIIFQIMLMYKIIESQLSTNPNWTLISHDRLCMAPHDGYNQSFGNLGLAWSNDTDEKIDSLNKTGKGFIPKRISSQQPSKWRKEVSDGERANIQRWADWFDLNHFFKQYVDLE